MTITDPILADLGYVLETNREVDMLHFYRSFPIICKGRLLSLEGGKVQVLTQPPGSVCLVREKTTTILSNRLLEAVKAEIIDFDIKTGIVNLGDFEYVGSRLGERMVARVEPKTPYEVRLEKEGLTLRGKLADISISGIGVYVQSSTVKKGELFTSHMALPEGEVTLDVKVLDVSSTPEFFRLAMKFTTNVLDIGLVMRYIRHRRAEIFSEVQDLYNQALSET